MATRYWLGNALPVAQVDTVTIGGTYLANDTITLTINGKDLIMTVGGTISVANLCTDLAAMVNGTTMAHSTRNTTGAAVPEFARITATATSTTVVLTADDAGVPFTCSVSKVSTSGTASLANTTAATGPNYLSNADNWSGLTLPTTGDDVVFQGSSVSALYGLGSLTDVFASVRIFNSFTGAIGLPLVNGTGSAAYSEYRTRYWSCNATIVEVGLGDGPGSERIMLDTGSTTTAITVHGSGTSPDGSTPAVLLKNSASAAADVTLEVLRGHIGMAYFPGETAKCRPRVGYRTNVEGDAVVVLGSGVTLDNVEQAGGNLTIRSATSQINKSAGTLTIEGTGAHPIVDNFGGLVTYSSTGALGATRVNVGAGATLDMSRDMSAKTVSTDVKLFARGTIRDPHGVVAALGVALQGCRLSDVTIESKFSATVDLS